MSKRWTAFLLSLLLGATAWAAPEHFQMRVVTSGLQGPHNMMRGPDGKLWLTELTGRRVLRVDPASGAVDALAQVSDAVHTKNADGSEAQDGLLGLALDPALMQGRGRDFVYVSLTVATPAGNRTVIRRYRYDGRALVDPLDVLQGLPSALDHQSARLLFGPDGKLYYSIGDQGANQGVYRCVPNEAQVLPTAAEVAGSDWRHYKGKVLRIDLDGGIPADNPVLGGVRSHVWAWGIRNTQGMAFGPGQRLYATDHGPNSDDEVNLIEAGRNYGWPNVAGYRDDSGYRYAAYAQAPNCEQLKDPARNGLVTPPGVPVYDESSFDDPAFTPPLTTFYTVGNDFDFQDPKCAPDLYFICWPTVAPSSVTYYEGGPGGLPGWGRSLLVTTLKKGEVLQLRLDATGTRVIGKPKALLRTQNRYRDLVVDPDRRTLYVATDPSGLASTDDGAPTKTLANPGAILAFTYKPSLTPRPR